MVDAVLLVEVAVLLALAAEEVALLVDADDEERGALELR
jgi:hypothetical protein